MCLSLRLLTFLFNVVLLERKMSSLSLSQLTGGFNAMVVSIDHSLVLLDHSQQFRPLSLTGATRQIHHPWIHFTNGIKALETVNCFVFKTTGIRPMALAIRLYDFYTNILSFIKKMYVVFFVCRCFCEWMWSWKAVVSRCFSGHEWAGFRLVQMESSVFCTEAWSPLASRGTQQV